MVNLAKSLWQVTKDLFDPPQDQPTRPTPRPGYDTSTPRRQPTRRGNHAINRLEPYNNPTTPCPQSSRLIIRVRDLHHRPDDDDRMPPVEDLDRKHFLHNSSKPRDATKIPSPGMLPLSGPSQSSRKPGASHAHRPINRLNTNSAGTLSSFSANTSNPYASGAKRGQHQSYAAKARGNTYGATLLDFPESTTRAPKRQRVEDMHRSQSSPAGTTVDLTEDEPPTTSTGRQNAGTIGQYGKPIKAHSIDSDHSNIDVKHRSGYFSTAEYSAVNDRLACRAPRKYVQASEDTRPASNTVSGLSEKKPPRNPPSIDRLMEVIGPPNIGTFDPTSASLRRKSQSEDAQTATEYGSHRRSTQFQKSPKKPDAFEEVHSRPARNSRIESEKTLSVSTTSPANAHMPAYKPWRWEIYEFSVRSTKIETDGILALEYNPQRSHFEVVNRDGPIVQGTGHLFIDTGNIRGIFYSSTNPLRVQILDRRRDHWQRFVIVAKKDLDEFLDFVQEKGVRKLEEKHSQEMEALFKTPHPFVSSNPPGLDEEATLLQARTRGRDETPQQHEPDHRADVRRERPAKLVSQMRSETEKAYDDLEPAWSKVRRNDLRQTRSTARVADDGYPSIQRRVKEEEAVSTPRPLKLSEDPGFGPEWPHPVVFPSTGRYQSQVSFSDLQRLEDGEFWNDSVISFCMAWYLHEAKEKIGFDETRIHIFSTYFCTKLWEPPTTNGINYGNVVRWTSKIDLFSREFVIVPVNDAEHWHLAIIVNMKNISKSLDEEATASDQTAEGDEVQPQSELKQNLFKTLGAGKSEKLSAQSNNRPNNPAKAAVKKTSSIDPDCTTIIVFDSLGATHPKTVKTLKQYIIAEAKAKLGLGLTARDIQTINAKEIPLQPNYYDCGVFVCGYFEKFMQDPDGFVKKVMYKEMDRVQDWPDLDPLNIRRSTLMTLLTLQQGQYRERKEVKKKKRKEEAEKQNSATPKESSPAKPSTDSSDDNAQPVTHPPQPPTELSTSIRESAPDRESAPENQEKRHFRSGSPRVVIPKVVPTPSMDLPAQAAAVGTPSKAPEQTAGKHLSKRSNDHDVMAFNADRPSKKPRLEERESESPSKKFKYPSPKSQTPKQVPKAETLSAAEGSLAQPVEIDRSAVQERPSRNRRARELPTEIPESPPHGYAERVVYPDGRGTSFHDDQTAQGHGKVRRLRRTQAQLKELLDDDNDEVIEVSRTPPQPEYQSDDDEFIEETSEVDLVRHPQHHDYHQHQWQADDGTTGVYGDSEMQESSQAEDLEDRTADLNRYANGQVEPKKSHWSPPPKDFRSKNYRPDLHPSDDYSLDERNGFRKHEVISLTDDDDDDE